MYCPRYLYKKYCTIFPVRSWKPLCYQLFQLSLCSNRNTFAQRGFQTFPKCDLLHENVLISIDGILKLAISYHKWICLHVFLYTEKPFQYFSF